MIKENKVKSLTMLVVATLGVVSAHAGDDFQKSNYSYQPTNATTYSVNSTSAMRVPVSQNSLRNVSRLNVAKVESNSSSLKKLSAPLDVTINKSAKNLTKDVVVLNDQYDEQLNATTFSWAREADKALVSPIADQKVAMTLAADKYLAKSMTKHASDASALKTAKMLNIHKNKNGSAIVQYKQQVEGIEVFGRQINILMNSDNQHIATSGFFEKIDNSKIKTAAMYRPGLSAQQAIDIALKDVFGDNDYSYNAVKTNEPNSSTKSFSLSSNMKSQIKPISDFSAKPVFFPMGDMLEYSYQLSVNGIDPQNNQLKAFIYVVSSQTGEILYRKNAIQSESYDYSVFADSKGVPMDGPYGNDLSPIPITSLDDDVVASLISPKVFSTDYGTNTTRTSWVHEDFMQQLRDEDQLGLLAGETTLWGNNVKVFSDTNDNFEIEPGEIAVTNNRTFNFAYGLDGNEQSKGSRDAALTNLFYVHNFLHDWFYDNGFDEKSGNAQLTNFGRGGKDGDEIIAIAHQTESRNNAWMLTNPDGDLVMTNMMYWDNLNGSMDIESIGSIAHQISSYFKPDSFNVSSSIVRLLDGVDDSNDGCSAPINDNEINGNVALINRGTCAFGLKITHAQQAGATAVIVTNNIPDEGLLTMGGGDYSINIPSVFVSYEDGQSILTLLAEQELEVELSGTLKTIDSALDNGVIAHEWGHYITNRLVQDATGLSNNQGGSLGEGWGDFISLMLMIREEDRNVAGNEQFQGYYADAQYAAQDLINGTRRAPYSIDMSKNGLTFKHIEDGVELPANVPASYNNAEVHNAGEIWAVTLLEAYVALLNREELSFQQAQERMKDYLVAGLKMTPMAPTYTEARDAFLSAALANDPIDFELMFESFAKRGMGINAVSPLRYSEDHAGVVEDFSINGAAADFKSISLSMFDANTEYCDNDNVLDVGETMTLMFEIVNRSTTALENVQIVLSSEADVTFSNGGIVEFPVGTKYGEALKGTIQMTLNSASHFEELNLTWSFVENDNVTLPAYNYATTITANYDIAANQRNNDDLELAPATLADWSGYVSDSAAKAFVLDGGLNDERFGRGQMFFGHHNDTHQVTAIFSPEVTVGDTGEFSLEFFHAFQFYRGLSTNGDTLNWSGGRILVSIDGADSVELDSTGAILDVGYNGEIDAFTLGDSEEHPKGFVESNGNGNMEKIVFPEGVLNGKTVKFVFVLLTGDTGVSEGGWWLDDFKFENTKTPAFSGISLEDGECVSRSNIGPSLDLIDYIAVKEKDSNGNRTIVTLEPTAFDPDGDELFYHWEQESGTTGLLSTTDTLSTTFTVPEVSFHEELILTLRVTDKHFSATKSVRIDVRNVNLAPEVSILADGSVQEKKEMTLLAQLTERDGDEVTYQWTQVSGPIVSTGSKTASSITFTAPEVEEDTTLVFQLVADDGLLESSIASKTITITNKKSSGGSMNWFILLLLGLTFHRRKFRK